MLALAIRYVLPVLAIIAVVGYVHHDGVTRGRAWERKAWEHKINVANARIKDQADDFAREKAELSTRVVDLETIVREELRRPAANGTANPACPKVKCQVSKRAVGAINGVMGAIKW